MREIQVIVWYRTCGLQVNCLARQELGPNSCQTRALLTHGMGINVNSTPLPIN